MCQKFKFTLRAPDPERRTQTENLIHRGPRGRGENIISHPPARQNQKGQTETDGYEEQLARVYGDMQIPCRLNGCGREWCSMVNLARSFGS